MDFMQHLISYYKGERFEAILLTIFGSFAIAVAIVMWQNSSQNQLLKGLFYPIAFLGVFTLLAGGFGVYNNSQRLAIMPEQYRQSPVAFIQAERKRFEGHHGVNTWWLPLKLLWAALLLVGIAIAFINRNDVTHGVAIGLMVIGTMGFVIDGFAHHRAKTYTAALLAHSTMQPRAHT